jgi:VanZ family protein
MPRGLLVALRWLPALLWMAWIFYWSGQSVTPAPSTLLSKLAHVLGYAVLALLLMLALLAWPRRAVLAWAIAGLYGVSDEIHQGFTPGRHPAMTDVLLDGAGALAALLALHGLLLLVRARGAATRRGAAQA